MRLIALLTLIISSFFPCFSQNSVDNYTVKGVFVDPRDNKEYETIKIGSQIWFAENFAFLPQIDTINVSVYGYKGKSIKQAKSSLSYQKYGALYSWEFAKNLAPEGWRLPTDADWQQLEKEIGISKEYLNTIGWRGTNNEVKNLKQGGKAGFNVAFGGWKTDYGEFKFQEQHANFWCADSYDNERAFERLIGVKNEKIGREYGNKGCGFSVRYVKDIPDEASVSDTTAIRNIIQEEIVAWNKGDAISYSRHFAADGTFTNLIGMFFTGHKEFEERHEQIFKGVFNGTVLQQNIVSLRFVRPDVAVVETITWISGFKTGPPQWTHADAQGRLRTRLLQVMVRNQGAWKIVVYHNVDLKPGVIVPEPL